MCFFKHLSRKVEHKMGSLDCNINFLILSMKQIVDQMKCKM